MRRKQSRGRSLIAADPRIHPAEFTLSSQDWMSRGRQEQGGSGFKNEGQARLLARIAAIRHDAIVHILWDLLIGARA